MRREHALFLFLPFPFFLSLMLLNSITAPKLSEMRGRSHNITHQGGRESSLSLSQTETHTHTLSLLPCLYISTEAKSPLSHSTELSGTRYSLLRVTKITLLLAALFCYNNAIIIIILREVESPSRTSFCLRLCLCLCLCLFISYIPPNQRHNYQSRSLLHVHFTGLVLLAGDPPVTLTLTDHP